MHVVPLDRKLENHLLLAVLAAKELSFLWVSSATPKPSLPPPLCLGTAMWKRSPINVSRVESPQLVVCMGCVLGKIYRKQHVAIPIFPSTNTQPSKDACHCLNLDPWIVHLYGLSELLVPQPFVVELHKCPKKMPCTCTHRHTLW